MTEASTRIRSIAGARVMDDGGAFGSPATVDIADGRFVDPASPTAASPTAASSIPASSIPASSIAQVLDATGLWVIPGVYDCHSHITWNDFHEEDRHARPADERRRLTERALLSTLRSGATNVRDAGGADAALKSAIADDSVIGPRLQISIEMISAADAGSGFRTKVLKALDGGADWVKLVATFGSTADPDAEIESNFSAGEFAYAVDTAAAYGSKVMVHAWGGAAIDYAIDAGAQTLEHGIYLTAPQAGRAVESGMSFVPTLTVYRLLTGLITSGRLEGVPLERIEKVVADHAVAVRLAAERGLPIAIGSDYSIPEQHGTNLQEIGALIRAGLTSGDALLAATRNGARLFDDDGADGGGAIAPGRRADAVILDRDPTDAATFDSPDSVVAVIKDGLLAYADPSLPRHR